MGYEASAARRDITPPQEWIDGGLIWLWGYGDRSAPCSGVADPLDARVVCIRDDDGGTVVFVTADVGALDPATTERVRTRLEASHGLARSQVCLNVSHTHSAPVAASIPTWQPGVAEARADYLALLEDAIVGAVDEAIAALRPATIEFGRGTTNVAVDRHVIAGVPLDRTLDVVRITGLDGVPIAVVFVAACHPTSFADRELISADFVGRARAGIEATAGGLAVFVQGYAGTCIPERRRHAGCRGRAGRGRGRRPRRPDGRAGRAGHVPARRRRAAAAADHPRQRRPRPRRSGALLQRWAAWMDTLGVAVPATLPTPLQSMTVGAGGRAWRLVASGHEVTTDLAGRVRAMWPYERVTRRRVHQQPALVRAVAGRAAAARAGHELPPRLDEEELRGRRVVRLVRAPRPADAARRDHVPRRPPHAARRRLDPHRPRHPGRRPDQLGRPAVRRHGERQAVVAAAGARRRRLARARSRHRRHRVDRVRRHAVLHDDGRTTVATAASTASTFRGSRSATRRPSSP